MARPGWYSDHPPACTCVGCSERGGVRTRTADRRGGGQPPTRVGTSLGNGGGYGRGGGSGGGNAWKWLAAVVVGVILIAVIYQAGSWPESGQPTPANVVPASTTASEATPPIRTAPSPAPDVRATTEAAIAATVEALRPTSTTEAVPLALAETPTRTRTRVLATRPTIPTPLLPRPRRLSRLPRQLRHPFPLQPFRYLSAISGTAVGWSKKTRGWLPRSID